MRRVVAVLSAAACVIAAGGMASASARVTPASHGVLAGVTSISWSGKAGISLRVPRPSELVGGDIDLYVSHATYAFVRFIPPAQPSCPDILGPHCDAMVFDWLHMFTDNDSFDGVPPGRRHLAGTSLPPRIYTPTLDVYLFTDGAGRIVIRAKGLTGSRAYRAAGRFLGATSVIRPTCVPLGCDSETGRTDAITYGGTSIDLHGLGYAEISALNRNDNFNDSNDIRGTGACLFPNQQYPNASPESRDYVLGCVPIKASDAPSDYRGMEQSVASTAPLSGNGFHWWWPDAHGKQYLGYETHSAGTAPGRSFAYAIWFSYGIT